jgi:hypothetical protein
MHVMRMKTILGTLVAGLALAAVTVPSAQASGTIGGFYTPGRAVYCELDRVFADVYTQPWLYCWTPNDGFTLWLGASGRPKKSYDIDNKWYHSGSVGLLRFGQNYWANADYQQGTRIGRGSVLFRCRSRSNGLTCSNRAGHGFWLGRYRGYRLF